LEAIMAEELSADYLVIGSGIIGSLAARKLALAGASVLILEAGPRVSRGEIVARFRNTTRRGDWMSPYPSVATAPHPIYQPKDNGYLVQAGPYPYPAEYIRQFGGTSWHWAAQAWRNVPNDFRIHTCTAWRVDWPISYEDLEPFYQEAEEIMGVSGADNTGSPRKQAFPMDSVAEPYAMRRIRERLDPSFKVVGNTVARNSVSYDGRPACCGNNSCQPICPIDAQYHGGIAAQQAEAAGVKISLQCQRLQAGTRRAGPHHGRPVLRRGQEQPPRHGKTFILAANGIESPRLLLVSASDKYPNGLANSSDMVSRNLMDHPSTSITFDADEDLWLGRGPQSPNSINTMRDGDFRSEHSPYRLDFTNISRVDGATRALIGKGVFGEEFEQQLRFRSAREMSLKNVLEVLPNPENRIALSSEKDAMGIPKPQAHYAIDDYTSGATSARAGFRQIARLMGGTNLRHSKEGVFANNQHICGTLSMGSDPAKAVCDQWGRTFDHANLFLCSTGVLPTSGTCNSTENGLAVALRTVKHILDEQQGATA
jgi:choline dehydrogenase-like flavoprotein